VSIPMG